MKTMRMSLISTCTSTRRSSRAAIIENYQIRAKILRQVVEDIYKKHYFPVTKESSIMFEYDESKDEIKESAVDWKKQHGLPKNVFAMSTCISKRVKWLIDTGCALSRDGKVTSRGTLCTEPSSCNTNHVERCIRTVPL